MKKIKTIQIATIILLSLFTLFIIILAVYSNMATIELADFKKIKIENNNIYIEVNYKSKITKIVDIKIINKLFKLVKNSEIKTQGKSAKIYDIMLRVTFFLDSDKYSFSFIKNQNDTITYIWFFTSGGFTLNMICTDTDRILEQLLELL